jgi:hypothetical protein
MKKKSNLNLNVGNTPDKFPPSFLLIKRIMEFGFGSFFHRQIKDRFLLLDNKFKLGHRLWLNLIRLPVNKCEINANGTKICVMEKTKPFNYFDA